MNTDIPSWRRYAPLVAGLVALVLAGVGEASVESDDSSMLGLILYLAAIALFAASNYLLPATPADLPASSADELPAARRRLRVWLILGGGTVLALALDFVALRMISADLASIPGAWLWLLSVLVLLSTGIAVARLQGWAARWGVIVWPSDRRWRRVVVLALAALLLLTVATRLLWLDRVPFGINADEGDRGATAIQIIHGDNDRSIFDDGWYWISMLYFWLLAQVMKVAGVSWVGARVFGALASIVSVGVITWIGIRNFGLRVGLIAGGILSVLGISLQFARETSEAGPTATLWTISAALFLEAARRGRSWAWIGAGVAGGLSIYFYTSGRLWVLMLALWGVYLLIHGLGGHRWGIMRGLALCAIASLVVMGPFLVHALHDVPDISHSIILVQRAQETSIFTLDNPTRLPYYNPKMNIFELLVVQTVHSVGVFNQFPNLGGFWPTDKPLMSGLLAILTLLGLAWCCLRVRDARFAMLALWFWAGFIGVIITVETPNVQRMATAVPVLALFPALALDSLARLVSPFVQRMRMPVRQRLEWAITGALTVVVAFMMWGEWHFYFYYYGNLDNWPLPTNLGLAVHDQGSDTLVCTIGRQHHEVNSGWVRLLAVDTPRGGIGNTGGLLPLPLPADRNLTFLLFPGQVAYFPLLREIYPVGETKPYTHKGNLMFSTYRISRLDWAATQGATVAPPQGAPVRVDALGEAPPTWITYPMSMRWTAGLRVPQYWNYSFQIGPGPARLSIDGTDLLTVPAGSTSMSATVSLAQGYHFVVYDGTLTSAGRQALFQWRAATADSDPSAVLPDWQSPGPGSVVARQSAQLGLYSVVQVEGLAERHRIEGTLANCCLSYQVRSFDVRPYTATWTSTLQAPTTGVYSMTLFAEGAIDLSLDGHSVFHKDKSSDGAEGFTVALSKGPHPLRIVYKVNDSAGGIEWKWTPPGGITSIVPPSALTPPQGSGVGPPVSGSTLGSPDLQPYDQPLEIVK